MTHIAYRENPTVEIQNTNEKAILPLKLKDPKARTYCMATDGQNPFPSFYPHLYRCLLPSTWQTVKCEREPSSECERELEKRNHAKRERKRECACVRERVYMCLTLVASRRQPRGSWKTMEPNEPIWVIVKPTFEKMVSSSFPLYHYFWLLMVMHRANTCVYRTLTRSPRLGADRTPFNALGPELPSVNAQTRDFKNPFVPFLISLS